MRSPLTPDDPRHGTANGYSNYGCRCVPCSDAERERRNRWRAANMEKERQGRARFLAANTEKERERKARYRAENRQKERERHARYEEANRDHRAAYRADTRDKARERMGRYMAVNAEKERERLAVWRAENADKAREHAARYRQTPKGQASHLARSARRRAAKRSLDCGCVSTAAMNEVWAADVGLCVYCGAEGQHLDHVVPLAAGGWHCISNLRVACERCNCSKNARPLAEFLADLAARGVTVMPNATAPGLPCLSADMRSIEDPWKVA